MLLRKSEKMGDGRCRKELFFSKGIQGKEKRCVEGEDGEEKGEGGEEGRREKQRWERISLSPSSLPRTAQAVMHRNSEERRLILSTVTQHSDWRDRRSASLVAQAYQPSSEPDGDGSCDGVAFRKRGEEEGSG